MAARFQFSIRAMLAATAMIAAGAAAVCAKPSATSSLAIDALSMVFTTVAIVAVMQTNGNWRAFWVGTAVLLSALAIFAVHSAITYSPWIGMEAGPLGIDPRAQQWFESQRDIWPFWCAAPVNGLFAVVLRWLLWPRAKNPKPPA